MAFDLMMRGGGIAVLLLVAGLSLRDLGRTIEGRLGALLATGAAAYLIETLPGFRTSAGLWSWPLFALMAGNSVMFWLMGWALFDDGFRPRPWHGAVWAGVVALASVNAFVLGPQHMSVAGLLDQGLGGLDLVFGALAVGQAIASWGGDLVERRRRVRLVVVAGGAAFIILRVVAHGLGTGGVSSDSAGLLVVAIATAVSLLGVRVDRPAATVKSAPMATPEEALHLARLEHLMAEERLYREPRLSIADVARRMGLPEYRLRRLINQGRGERNFAAFVNGFRIDEVKAALADPTQAEVPVLTIALDAGFGSLGPFNRAFRAATGVTPSEFRQEALSQAKTAGRISKSA